VTRAVRVWIVRLITVALLAGVYAGYRAALVAVLIRILLGLEFRARLERDEDDQFVDLRQGFR
jgi:hypothetical protein